MRLVFLGEVDDYGYMANWSSVLNAQTDHISNAVVYTDNHGYDADVVIKRKRKFGGVGTIDEAREMAMDFLSQAEVIIINDTISPIHLDYGFHWRDMAVNAVIKGKPIYVFLQNVKRYYNNTSLLVKTYDEYAKYASKIFTNQPFISYELIKAGRECQFFTQPLACNIPKMESGTGNCLLYRPYVGLENTDAIVDLANFVFNERNDFSYKCVKNVPYTETRAALVGSSITIDSTAVGVLGLPFYEGLYAGHYVVCRNQSTETYKTLADDGLDLRNVYATDGAYLSTYNALTELCDSISPRGVTQEFNVLRFVRFIE